MYYANLHIHVSDGDNIKKRIGSLEEILNEAQVQDFLNNPETANFFLILTTRKYL